MEDLVCQLPEGIIHHILSHLETKEAARTSIFCKTWYRAWLMCPTLNFRKSLDNPIYNSDRREKFLKFIKNTSQRYHERNICVLHLVLCLSINDSISASFVDEWIGIALQNGVKKLELNFHAHVDKLNEPYPYTLPRKIFETRSLEELIVRGIKVMWRDDRVMFTHLRKLHLFHIFLDDDMFQDIIVRCPLINNLGVYCCEGLDKIKVTKLYNLKEFTVWDWCNQLIEIDAPHLQYLECSLNALGCLDLYKTEKLKYLSLDGTLPSTTFFDNFMHKFAQLEDLRLAYCNGLETINISSQSLKRIVLKDMENLREVKIDAPSICMLSFEFHYPLLFPDVSLTNVSSQCVSKINISNPYRMDTYQLCKLKGFLAKLIPSKISLHLLFHPEYCRFDDLRNIQVCPVVVIEDLHLRFGFETTTLTNPNVLDALFLTCHPKAITTRRWNEKAIWFLYENLIRRRNHDCCIVTCHEMKSCWCQDLMEVRFEIYNETKHEWQPSYLKNNLLEEPWDWKRVCFRLEWKHIICL